MLVPAATFEVGIFLILIRPFLWVSGRPIVLERSRSRQSRSSTSLPSADFFRRRVPPAPSSQVSFFILVATVFSLSVPSLSRLPSLSGLLAIRGGSGPWSGRAGARRTAPGRGEGSDLQVLEGEWTSPSSLLTLRLRGCQPLR